MIDTYARLHREEQRLRRVMGEEPRHMGPAMGLAIGCGITVVGLLLIVGVISFFGFVLS